MALKKVLMGKLEQRTSTKGKHNTILATATIAQKMTQVRQIVASSIMHRNITFTNTAYEMNISAANRMLCEFTLTTKKSTIFSCSFDALSALQNDDTAKHSLLDALSTFLDVNEDIRIKFSRPNKEYTNVIGIDADILAPPVVKPLPLKKPAQTGLSVPFGFLKNATSHISKSVYFTDNAEAVEAGESIDRAQLATLETWYNDLSPTLGDELLCVLIGDDTQNAYALALNKTEGVCAAFSRQKLGQVYLDWAKSGQ